MTSEFTQHPTKSLGIHGHLLLLWLLFQNRLYQPNGLIKRKVVMQDLNAKFEWTTTSMSPTQHFSNLGYFVHLV